jgi:hypothetical protein
MGELSKVSNLATTIFVSVCSNLTKFGSSANKEGYALGVVY